MRGVQHARLSFVLYRDSPTVPGRLWRLNQENFDKIREGMSQREVREILGEPVDASGASLLGLSSSEAVWKDDKTTIAVHFLNDKVVSKQMSRTEKKGSSAKDEGRS